MTIFAAMKQTVKAGLVFSIAIMITLTACNKTEVLPESVIEESGLLGTWEFKTYEVNGISDMIIYSGDFIVLNEDDLPGDREGKVRAYGPGYDRTGTFILSVQNDSMTVFLEDDVNEYAFFVQGDQLFLDYIEDGSQYSTTWVKVP